MNSWNQIILISFLFKSKLIKCSTWCLFFLEDSRNQISVKCPTTCCNLNATSTEDVCCENQELYPNSLSLGLWLIIVPVFLFFCCFIVIFSIIACVTKLNCKLIIIKSFSDNTKETLQLYQQRRRRNNTNNNNENLSTSSTNVNLDPRIYSINNNLDSIDQSPPSYSINYGFNESTSSSSQLPKYEDLIRMNQIQAYVKSNELSKV